MSAAIKRLSTIIRPSSNSSSSSPPKESGKDSIDAPAPAAPVDSTATETAPSPQTEPNGKPADAPKDAAVDSAAPEQAPTASPDVKDALPADAPKDTDAPAPAAAEPKPEKEGKPEKEAKPTRRDPRDIGLSTIRRFSTILRSQAKEAHKDKEPTPPLPSQEQQPAKPTEGEPTAPAAQEAPKEVPKENGKEGAAPEKDAKPAPAPTATKDKPEQPKVSKRRSAAFFTAAREGLQRTAKDVQTRARGQPGAKAKAAAAAAKVEAVPKIVKKGAAKGKRVVVITGASKGVGLEFVKQFAGQPDTFVIALSRTADKAPALKPIVSASAKDGHNVRAIKLDVASSRSVHNVVKDIVELTDGRIDLLINAAGSRGDPGLKIWDLKGSELEDELRNNLVGPIAFTNALIPYLKPMPAEEKKEEKETKPEKDETEAAVKEEKKATETEEKPAPAEKKEEMPEEAAATPADAATLQTEKETKLDAQEEPAVVAPTAEPSAETSAEAAPAGEAPPTEAAPAKPTPAAAPAPPVLPAQPFIVFLAPSDPIQNVGGAVPTGSAFAPSPRTLFSLSRAALQVAIAKYAVGLGGKGVGVVGLERCGLDDPHSEVSDAQAAKQAMSVLPGLTVRDNGKLLKATGSV